jgi:hypothetical protein
VKLNKIRYVGEALIPIVSTIKVLIDQVNQTTNRLRVTFHQSKCKFFLNDLGYRVSGVGRENVKCSDYFSSSPGDPY